jgi:hypothetical protein
MMNQRLIFEQIYLNFDQILDGFDQFWPKKFKLHLFLTFFDFCKAFFSV